MIKKNQEQSEILKDVPVETVDWENKYDDKSLSEQTSKMYTEKTARAEKEIVKIYEMNEFAEHQKSKLRSLTQEPGGVFICMETRMNGPPQNFLMFREVLTYRMGSSKIFVSIFNEYFYEHFS